MRQFLSCLLCGVLALAPGARAAEPQPAGDPHVLVMGAVSDDPAGDYGRLKPLLEYAVARMEGVGIREGRILMARDVRQMASYLRRGRVDWVTGSAATGVRLQMQGGAQPLLLDERDGASRYHAVVFVRSDSRVRRLEDLRGGSIAFADGSSTAAYYMPALRLLDRQLPLQLLASPLDRPGAGAVGYVFARSQANIAAWVHRGLVEAGTASDADWDNPQSMPPGFRDGFVVVDRSPEYPRALEVVRGDLAAGVRDRLREVLLQAGTDPDAREPLLEFARTTRFLPIDADAESGLGRVREGVERVRAEVE
ncbi:MAG TPA: phosphate/phosphite/phosphonate ABC transporter substrate-binding protein [Xanthomonadaceae bacterium]|nr:phosphate/phosphite/phosphonate ABC transporter substrate-binding protein [Xanthomonadaceae bacterium]